MNRLTLTDYLLTLLIVIALAFGAAQLLQHWITQVNTETAGKIERAGY